MKSTYQFKATAKTTDYTRICRENPEAAFLIVRSEGMEPLTLVPFGGRAHKQLSMRAGAARPTGRVVVPAEAKPFQRTRTWLIYEGDISQALDEPRLLTKVEVY